MEEVIFGMEKDDTKKRVHPTQKPTLLIEWLLGKFSDKTDIIIDPFSGSGTTLIACHNLSRKCRAVELSPAYVAVTLQRFLDHTGITPALIGTEPSQ